MYATKCLSICRLSIVSRFQQPLLPSLCSDFCFLTSIVVTLAYTIVAAAIMAEADPQSEAPEQRVRCGWTSRVIRAPVLSYSYPKSACANIPTPRLNYRGASAMFAENNLPQDDYDELLDLSRSVEP